MATIIENNNHKKIDWMCVARYAIYGALVGGLLADVFVSAMGNSVYLGAVIGAALLSAAKLVFLFTHK